jgi:hypothetical protein
MKHPLSVLACLILASPSLAADRVDYLRDVKPILKEKCFACHGGLKQEASLRLDTAAFVRLGGDGGAAIKPGDAAASLLMERVTSQDEDARMPQQGSPLSPQQIVILQQWINSGAAGPAEEQPEDDPTKHWAFQTPIANSLPVVKDPEWVRNPIDAFISAQRDERALTANPPAEKQILLRRVYLDLIGLPPTRDELQVFLADTSEHAYENVVDRLLASPQYGERWSRHWMDVWRYSDWYGRRKVPDSLNSYGQIWRWRDWIVRSLNEDKGYDGMVVEMLAADEIAPEDDENIVATGFIVRNFYRWNYNTWMKDAVEHTSKAFLGLTLNCCHCHDHKYDPITNEEYFRFRAFFEPIEIRHDRVAGEPDPGPYPKYSYGKAYKPITSGLVRIMDEKLDAETFIYTGGESRNVIPGKPPVVPGGVAILGGGDLEIEAIDLPAMSWYPGLKEFVREAAISKAEADRANMQATLVKAKQLVADAKNDADRAAAELTLKVDQANVARAEAARAAIEARIHADDVRYQGKSGDADEVAKAASQAERQAALETARVELYRAERALAAARGKDTADAKVQDEIKKAQAQVSATKANVDKAAKALATVSATYTLFSPQYPKQSTGRRTALARWIASERNPLTARVAVNHIWSRHFGRAFVETTENFGRSGAQPTHPRLLDWLAVELMSNGWQMKHIHRLIVTSNTYRMSSRGVDNPSYEGDRDNQFLWRFNPARMEAEAVRDGILHVAGSLNEALGGKEIDVKLGLTRPRRSIYFEHHGEGRMQMLDLFDAADPCDCYRRTTSVRPQQALAMANSELAIRESRLLARRLHEECEEEASAAQVSFISAAFEQVLARAPTSSEREASSEFLRKQTALFASVDSSELATAADRTVPPSTDPSIRARENLVQALFSHHDFVTIR